MNLRLVLLILFATIAPALLAEIPSQPTTQPPTQSPTQPTTRRAIGKHPASQPDQEDHLSTTHHELTINGKTLGYTAMAGPLTIHDETGKALADVFYVSYQIDGVSDPSKRPIMFLFNGGPGSAAVWLHLGAAGPKTIELNKKDLPIGPPYRLVDNDSTWLTASDLVFVDPVSTGYSRAAPGEKPEQFHGVQPDIESVSAFIRLYLTKNNRWASPVYLAGESYGTTRAAAMVEFLAERYGISVNGVILMSSVLDFQTLIPKPGNDLPYEMYLPSYAAVAWYHHRLAGPLQNDFNKTIEQARDFAINQYATALLKGAALPADQRAAIIQQLASFTGLSADLIDRSNLRIDPNLFEKELLGDGHQIIGRFDGRITGYDANAVRRSPDYDPSLVRYLPAYASTFNDYVRRELKYESDLPYEVLTSVQPWNFGQESGGYLYVVDDLESALLRNPHLRVMFVSGYFDLATPFYSADYTIDRLNLDPSLRANITHEFFPTGHMVYHNHDARQKLSEDVAKLINER